MNKFLLTTAMGLVLMVSGAAYAEDAVSTPKNEDDNVIIVVGKGVRHTQTMTAANLAIKTPGTSPIKLVERLPGVNFSSADPFGAYEWAVRINVRGFSQQQMGFTLDGVPLGDMSYGNFNGLHISRAIISENLGEAQIQHLILVAHCNLHHAILVKNLALQLR